MKLQHNLKTSLVLLMNLTMFTLSYTSAMLVIHIKYGLMANPLNALVLVFLILTISCTFLLFYLQPCYFDYFYVSFRPTMLTLNHYYFYFVALILTSVIMVLQPEHPWAAVVPLGLLFLYTVLMRPYKYTRDNVRVLFNLLIMMAIILFKVYVDSL